MAHENNQEASFVRDLKMYLRKIYCMTGPKTNCYFVVIISCFQLNLENVFLHLKHQMEPMAMNGIFVKVTQKKKWQHVENRCFTRNLMSKRTPFDTVPQSTES